MYTIVYLKVRRGLVVSTVRLPPAPTSLKYRVLNTLELCSSEKKQKIQKGVKGQEEKVWFI